MTKGEASLLFEYFVLGLVFVFVFFVGSVGISVTRTLPHFVTYVLLIYSQLPVTDMTHKSSVPPPITQNLFVKDSK